MRIWKGFNEKRDYIGHMHKKAIAFSNKILRNRLTSKLFFSARLTWELAGLTKGSTMEAILRGIGNEQEFWKRGEEDASRLLKFINKETIVLDVGCGIGRVMKSMAPHCREVHGVDTSALILRRAKNELIELKNCFFHRSEFARFSFPANSFDLIYSFYTLQHMEKEDAYLSLRRMYDLLKPQGIIYVQFPDFCSDHYFSLFEEYALRHSKYWARVRCYTKPEIEQLYAGAGFKILEYNKENENIFVTGKKLANETHRSHQQGSQTS